MKKKKNSKRAIAFFMIILIVFTLWAVHGNNSVSVAEYTVISEKIPESFNGYRITQVSDLHDALIGSDNKKLLDKIKNTQPDIIVLTGDMIDSTRPDEDISISFIEKAVEIAPTYYITGNHESQLKSFRNFQERIINAGATYLRNESITISRNGASVNLIGIDDPFFLCRYIDSNEQISVHSTLNRIVPEEGYNILLAHRPDYYDIYVINGINLALCGHTHGGQFRVPILGGLYSPEQGFFPMYDKGLFTSEETTMIVSSGVGNSSFPIRLNNPPEIVAVTLKNTAE